MLTVAIRLLWACGGPEDHANRAKATDECTPRGPLYACQSNPTCDAEYMPVSDVSCGKGGGYCCLKGAVPPVDASSDGG